MGFNKICELCRNEFIAQKRTTRYCSHLCNKRAYKMNKRLERNQEVVSDFKAQSTALTSVQLLEEIKKEVEEQNEEQEEDLPTIRKEI